MIRKTYNIFLAFFFFATVYGQDYHFSQFDANPFFLNPALLGERWTEYEGIQVNGNYRDQISRFTKNPGGYKSVALGLDEPLNSKFSSGQYFYNNNSATGDINTFGISISGAYKIIDQRDNGRTNHNLSVGIQLGFYNRSFHPVNFTYDRQYSPDIDDGFDETVLSGENYVRDSYYNFNVNYGVYYRVTNRSKKVSGFGGFSIFNIAQSNEAFTDMYHGLPLRYNLHVGTRLTVTQELSMMSQLLYMTQAKATELNMNVLMFYKISGSSYEPIWGLGFRKKNALIFQLGVRFHGTDVRVSYDVVTGPLKNYRNSGIEFSLIKTFKKIDKSRKLNEPVPHEPDSIR